MSDLATVARRLEREVGLPAADAMRIARKLDKLGWHASDTGELSFSDVRVPADHLIGDPGKAERHLGHEQLPLWAR